MTIRELLDGIKKLDLVLPEFQREYVWEREQAKQLLVSLLRGYPTGSLLVWKTDRPPDIKNSAIDRERIGSTSVILDGQQRLTTLYLFTRGEIPPYYTAADIQNDPRDLYFDLESGEFQYYQTVRMQANPTWVQVVECFRPEPLNVFEIARTKAGPDQDPFQLAQVYNNNLNRLRNVLEKDYPIQTVPSNANIDDAIDVFDRVNSLGTKLTDAELALAHVTGKWPHARRVMKEKLAELDHRHFYFDLTFLVRSLTGVVKGRALFETIHDTEAGQVEEGWSRLNKFLDYLVSILPRHGHINSTQDLNTTNVLVPAVVYLARHDGKFASDQELRRFLHWMYAASVWSRYTSQTDQRLDHDLSIIVRADEPWAELVDAIVEQRGRIEVKPADLEGRGTQHPLYRMLYVLAKRRGAADWFNGLPLDTNIGKSYDIHSHHIFPTSLLYEGGRYSVDNHLHKKIVNEIANRAFLIDETNLELTNRPPAEYLEEIRTRYPGALEKQFIPIDPALWSLDAYEGFLGQRRKLIADAFNELMASLSTDLQPQRDQSLAELARGGENATVEFKSSLRWDVRESRVNKDLEKVVAKTIAGFLNVEGGVLLVGVADDGTVLGLRKDFETVLHQNRDGFQSHLTAMVSTFLGAEFVPYLRISFEDADGKTACIVRVTQSPRPVFLADRGEKEFYIRAGNTTRPLDMEAMHSYIGMHWEA
ncbi:MAG: DUF262 domain-containing protein [Planctomycetes bacterium]|nr:DUF262 domain-containing protein [Planctomycetota bacterium]